jgi:hypothetical protein
MKKFSNPRRFRLKAKTRRNRRRTQRRLDEAQIARLNEIRYHEALAAEAQEKAEAEKRRATFLSVVNGLAEEVRARIAEEEEEKKIVESHFSKNNASQSSRRIIIMCSSDCDTGVLMVSNEIDDATPHLEDSSGYRHAQRLLAERREQKPRRKGFFGRLLDWSCSFRRGGANFRKENSHE